LLWKWRYLAIKVTYYGGYRNDKQRYRAARTAYEEGVWETLQVIRGEVSRSRRFVSEEAYRKLVSLYMELVGLDRALSDAMTDEIPTESHRQELSAINMRIFGQTTIKIDEAHDFLSVELKLKKTEGLWTRLRAAQDRKRRVSSSAQSTSPQSPPEEPAPVSSA